MNLVVDDEPLGKPDEGKVAGALIDGIRQAGIQCLPWDKASRSFQARVNFLHLHGNDIPDLSDDALLTELEKWLLPWLARMSRLEHLRRLDLKAVLTSLLTWEQRQRLDRIAPVHITVPSGSRIPVNYENPEKPALFVRIQEMFGLQKTPAIAEGKAPLTVHLLSPAGRPIQVTEDLAGFWATTYFEVKKELKGRYPRHYWPDDPSEAAPTNRVKRKGG